MLREWRTRTWLRLKALLNREQFDRDLNDELQFHVAKREEKLASGGVEAEEAHLAARHRFGNTTSVREVTRAMWTINWLENLWQDLRYGARVLGRNPGFTAVAILTLALGIGGTTAIFTLVQQVMLRSLPVAQPDQLWRIGDANLCCYSDGYAQTDNNGSPQNDRNLFSWEAYKVFRANTPAFQDLAAFQIGEANAHLGVRRADSPAPVETANGEYVSGNFFKTFGISAWRGRLFTDADDQEGAPPVAVMSFHTWQGKYGSDPSVAGTKFDVNGHPFTIVGIAAPGFFGAKIAGSDMPDFWLPATTEPLIAGKTSRLNNPRLAWLDLIGRVRPGTYPKTLEAQLQVELRQWLASHVADMSSQEKALWEKQTLRLTPGGAGVSLMRENYKDSLWLLFMAALCVLLVACANIANLLLARGLKDRPQTALRAALGASRVRLVLKALAESLMLSVCGAVAGIAVAYAGAGLILHLAFTGPDSWVPVDAAPSTAVLLFALGISMTAGIVFGVAPAWMTSRAEPLETLRGVGRSVGRNRHWAQKSLVIVQAAVSLVLLSAAAMLGQSLNNMEHQNFGFETSGRYLVSINLTISNYKQEQLVPLFREINDHLRAIPGVRMAGAVLEAPLTGWVWPRDIRIEGKPEEDGSSGWTRVTPGFFNTLGDKIVMGRAIADQDTANSQPVAVINESFAKRYFAGENPIGQHFGSAPQKNAGMYEIVGVASDVNFGEGPQPMYFLPEAQSTHFDDPEMEEREVGSHYLYNIVIWAPGNPPGLGVQVKRAVADVDPNLVMPRVQSYSEVIHSDFAQQYMIASLTWLFGAVGLVLAAVGLYGVTAYGVERRTSEFGVRLALGAAPGDLLRLILGQGMRLAAIGVIVGVIGALGITPLLKSFLFGIKPTDALTIVVAASILAAVAFLACVIPARRATRVDPMVALRHD